jgi:hypothetical protein
MSLELNLACHELRLMAPLCGQSLDKRLNPAWQDVSFSSAIWRPVLIRAGARCVLSRNGEFSTASPRAGLTFDLPDREVAPGSLRRVILRAFEEILLFLQVLQIHRFRHPGKQGFPSPQAKIVY